MQGAIIYFSATGNSEYVAEEFEKEFKRNNIECKLIDIVKNKRLDEDYDFYVFGCPIHAEMFPYYYTDWIKQNVMKGNKKRTIIFSTQGSGTGTGTGELRKILKERGFNVEIQQPIRMPNNYYVVGLSKNTEEEKIKMCIEAKEKVSDIVKKFLLGEEYIKEVSSIRLKIGTLSYRLFYKYSKNWAKKKLSVDTNKCIKCRKCEVGCPVGNINMGEKITFNSCCISCQRCIHICPVNAFLYKGKHFEQYKLNNK